MIYPGLLLLAFVLQSGVQDTLRLERAGITIINGGRSTASNGLGFRLDAGPVVGDILNAHYFPGLQDYGAGRYDYAETQMTYVVNRTQYLEENPRRGEFLSTAYYIRGMIYLYHASGIGRHRLARADFEAAIKCNPQNYVAYLELSRVYSELGLNEPAISIVRHLLDLRPDETVADQGRLELKKLGVDQTP